MNRIVLSVLIAVVAVVPVGAQSLPLKVQPQALPQIRVPAVQWEELAGVLVPVIQVTAETAMEEDVEDPLLLHWAIAPQTMEVQRGELLSQTPATEESAITSLLLSANQAYIPGQAGINLDNPAYVLTGANAGVVFRGSNPPVEQMRARFRSRGPGRYLIEVAVGNPEMIRYHLTVGSTGVMFDRQGTNQLLAVFEVDTDADLYVPIKLWASGLWTFYSIEISWLSQ